MPDTFHNYLKFDGKKKLHNFSNEHHYELDRTKSYYDQLNDFIDADDTRKQYAMNNITNDETYPQRENLYNQWQNGSIYKQRRTNEGKLIPRKYRQQYWDDVIHFMTAQDQTNVNRDARNMNGTDINIASDSYITNTQNGQNASSLNQFHSTGTNTNDMGDKTITFINNYVKDGTPKSDVKFSTNYHYYTKKPYSSGFN